MVIKRPYKRVKALSKPSGFIMFEAVAFVGCIILATSMMTLFHRSIMTSYHAAQQRMTAFLYAENRLSSLIAGVPLICDTSGYVLSHTKKRLSAGLSSTVSADLVIVEVSWKEGTNSQSLQLSEVVVSSG